MKAMGKDINALLLMAQKQHKIFPAVLNPKLAQDILDGRLHPEQRKEKSRNIRNLVSSIIRNRLFYPGPVLMFDKKGQLINGMHTCRSVVAAGTPIVCIFIEGCDKDAMIGQDQQARRTFKDVLDMRHKKNTALAAAITMNLLRYQNGQSCLAGTYFNNEELEELYITFEDDIDDAAHFVCGHTALKNIVTTSYAGLVRLITRRINEEKSTYFFDRLADGSNLKNGDAIKTLRDKLIKGRMETNRRMRAGLEFLYVTKAWNAYYHGKQIKCLKVNGDEKIRVEGGK